MNQQELTFRCYGCRMTLHMPTAMEKMSIPKIRQFFKFFDQEYWRNEESTRLFFGQIPDVLAFLKEEWDAASRNFISDYQDPEFDSGGNYISDKMERQKRRDHNKRLMNKVKSAKAAYGRFEKRIPKLKELQELYQR